MTRRLANDACRAGYNFPLIIFAARANRSNGRLSKDGYFDGLDIHDAERFNDSLAVSPGTSASEPLKIMREAFQVKGAERQGKVRCLSYPDNQRRICCKS